jgi:hypothetical protein
MGANTTDCSQTSRWHKIADITKDIIGKPACGLPHRPPIGPAASTQRLAAYPMQTPAPHSTTSSAWYAPATENRGSLIVDMDTGASEFGDIVADARVVPDRGVIVTNAEAMALTEAFGSATTTSRTTWQSTSPPTKRIARTTQATGSCGLTRTQKP